MSRVAWLNRIALAVFLRGTFFVSKMTSVWRVRDAANFGTSPAGPSARGASLASAHFLFFDEAKHGERAQRPVKLASTATFRLQLLALQLAHGRTTPDMEIAKQCRSRIRTRSGCRPIGSGGLLVGPGRAVRVLAAAAGPPILPLL